ncbi:Sensor protein ZraS [Fundidesulfovibrio magnetotacticus]|uniref:histidine kinase n=1 Tax=Fundidesulfovibrio magnetotacticus TaxID=2730080 RepID=A0A6V8LYM5_9BACT|nr:ATP-binding protein [Fundidesulfovibrio magnetotacticus]GFK94896.1 Sensor protein ZraS [Fundidesulfovibrio magnetotacticus]
MSPERLPDGYCLWELEDSAFCVGIMGTGPGFLSILDIIFNPAVADFLPPMTLAALAEPGPEREKLGDPRVEGLPVYETHQEMLRAHPDINLLIELVGKRHKVKSIVAGLPGHVSFIDHTASFFLCALNKFAAISARCQLNLDNQRVLVQAVLDEVPEDILLLDRQGRVVDVNRNVALRRGAPKEELLGKPCWDVQAVRDDMPFCHPETRDCPFHQALRTGRKAESLETRVSKEGRLLYFREYAYPIFDASGGISHVMVMRRDITSRTESEKRAQQTEKVGVVERLSAYMAHEIRNPLFAIGGFTNALLKSPNLSEREREKVRIILEETAKLDRILKEMIGFSRPGSEQPGEVDAASVAREAVEVLRAGFLPAGVEIALRLEEALPRVKAHEETLRRAMMHLVTNALEAMDGPGLVEVSAGLSAGNVMLSVRDTGRGMSQETLERVFSPFFTGKGLGKGKGYGLGLALIRKAVEDWGGRVEVASREGAGTTVSLVLPPALALP